MSKTNKILSLKKYDNLFKNKILPIFNFQFKGLNKNFNNQIIKNKYKFSDYILSPSDFGFHNIIIKDKKCYFIDFEYSGFDDPHKLIF